MVEDLKPAMNNDHQREEQIFEAALQFPTPEQRAAFVKGAWGMMKRFANVSKPCSRHRNTVAVSSINLPQSSPPRQSS